MIKIFDIKPKYFNGMHKYIPIIQESDLGRIQTCNLLSRNQVHYSVMLRGLSHHFLSTFLKCKYKYDLQKYS